MHWKAAGWAWSCSCSAGRLITTSRSNFSILLRRCAPVLSRWTGFQSLKSPVPIRSQNCCAGSTSIKFAKLHPRVSSLQGLGFMDQETCENVRQLCMLAAHEQSEKNLTSIVAEIYRLVAGPTGDHRQPLQPDAPEPRNSRPEVRK